MIGGELEDAWPSRIVLVALAGGGEKVIPGDGEFANFIQKMMLHYPGHDHSKPVGSFELLSARLVTACVRRGFPRGGNGS